MSYANDASPGAVKFTGNEVVTEAFETEKIEAPLSATLNKFPAKLEALAPILILKRLPVAAVVWTDPGDQSRVANDPVVKDVAVEEMLNIVPVV